MPILTKKCQNTGCSKQFAGKESAKFCSAKCRNDFHYNDRKIKMDDNYEKNILEDQQHLLVSLNNQINETNSAITAIYEKEKNTADYKEKADLQDSKYQLRQKLRELNLAVINQKNIVKALQNNGAVIKLTDKTGFEYNIVPDFKPIASTLIEFNADTILTDPLPDYVPYIDEEIFRQKGYVFDAIRLSNDNYLLATCGYDEKAEAYQLATVTLDQLVLINQYYFVRAKANLVKQAADKNARQEANYDSLPEEKRQFYFNQVNFYASLPAAVQKKISKADFEKLSLAEKETFYKPFKKYGTKRLVSKLDDRSMWRSYHYMYNRFINPIAVQPKPGYAHPDAWAYWETFRQMMQWKIKDLSVQRQDFSDARKAALETSFGDSNTSDALKNEFGIFVKRQNGTTIMPEQINQIQQAWLLTRATIGNLKTLADTDGLKISHTGDKYVFASKAVGMYVPSMRTIAVSNKYGENQFVCTLAHELAHYIDHKIGELNNRRFITDDFESKAGQIAITFRKYMNTESDSDYVNATKECFARAVEQYFAIENFGDNALISFSYSPLDEVKQYVFESNYVSKDIYYEKIRPMVVDFLNNERAFIGDLVVNNAPIVVPSKVFLTDPDEIIEALAEMAVKAKTFDLFYNTLQTGLAENWNVDINSDDTINALELQKNNPDANKKILNDFYNNKGKTKKAERAAEASEIKTEMAINAITEMAEQANAEVEKQINDVEVNLKDDIGDDSTLIYSPRNIDQLKQSLKLISDQNLKDEVYHTVQANYFNEYVAIDPTKITDFLLAIDHLKTNQKFKLNIELLPELLGSSKYNTSLFIDNLLAKNLNLYFLLPEKFRKSKLIKPISFLAKPDNDGLAKIMDLFVSVDNLRPVMMGVYFDVDNNLIAATDAHKLLCIYKKPAVKKSSICLMGKAKNVYEKERLNEIKRNKDLLEKAKKQGKKVVSTNTGLKEVFENEDGCWRIDANYPNYLSVIPYSFETVISVTTQNLLDFCKNVGDNISHSITHKIIIGYTNKNEKEFYSVDAYTLYNCLAGMLMLGHDKVDFCLQGANNKATVIVPQGYASKINYGEIKTDVALCMPLMSDSNIPYLPMYDLSTDQIKTVDQFKNDTDSITEKQILKSTLQQEIDDLQLLVDMENNPETVNQLTQEIEDLKLLIELEN